MMNDIHPTAVIDPTAKIGVGNTIGPYTVIGPRVVIGDGNQIGPHVCIGGAAHHLRPAGDGGVKIGHGNVIREFASVHRSTNPELPTVIGNDCYLMAYSHVAHDCHVEDGVVMCNGATLGGHCYVMKGANLGYQSLVHQRQVIGSYCMLGMGSVVTKTAKVEPGGVWQGNPARYAKRNAIGLERAEVSDKEESAEHRRYIELAAGWAGHQGGSLPLHSSPSSPAASYTTASVLAILREYAKTRTADFAPMRWEICEAAVKAFEGADFPTFAELYDKTFSLLWQQQEDFEATQHKIRARLVEPARELFSPYPLPGGPNVAWLVRHIQVGMYAPWKHAAAFIEGQRRSGVALFVYCYGSVDKAERRRLEEGGVRVRVSNDPAEIRTWCEHDGIGTLIAESYAAITLALFEMRSAPVQLYLSPGFQMFPADSVLIPPTQNHWAPVTDAVPSPMLLEHLCKHVPTAPKPGRIVFGVLGRYEKMCAEYLDMVREILELTPGAVFCAWGTGEFKPGHPRMHAMGYADPHSVLPQIDVYLDTYTRTGGISVWEAMAHRIPVVTRNMPNQESWNLFKPHLVHSREEYVAKAIDLLHNPETDRGYQTVMRFTDVEAAGRRLNEVIEDWHSRTIATSRQALPAG